MDTGHPKRYLDEDVEHSYLNEQPGTVTTPELGHIHAVTCSCALIPEFPPPAPRVSLAGVPTRFAEVSTAVPDPLHRQDTSPSSEGRTGVICGKEKKGLFYHLGE